jgi:hypothetical protein
MYYTVAVVVDYVRNVHTEIRSIFSLITVGLYLYGRGYSLSTCWILVMTRWVREFPAVTESRDSSGISPVR